MCFRGTFVASFLIDGVGFPESYYITALTILNGQKVGWALGSMLYEINTLPWDFKKKSLHKLLSLEALADDNFELDNSELVLGALLLVVLVVGMVSSLRIIVLRQVATRAARVTDFLPSETTALTRVASQRQESYGAGGYQE